MKNILLLPIALMFSCATGQGMKAQIFSKEYDVYEDREYHGLHIGAYYVHNNVWGKDGIVRYQQGVFSSEMNGGEVFGWRWHWPLTDGYTVRGYPETIIGTNPWLREKSDYFPCKTTDKKIRIDYDVSIISKGEHNFAFDIWLIKSSLSDTKNITHEIMIWMGNYGMTPGGTKKDSVFIDGVEYGVYVWENVSLGLPEGQRTYVAFVADGRYLSGSLNVHKFMEYLVEHGRSIQVVNFVTRELYIASIELGTEIVDGTGEIRFDKFDIIIE